MPWWEWLLIAIVGGVAVGVILKVVFAWWGRFEKNHAKKKVAKDARFKNLKENLTRIETHMSETRDRPPAYINVGCLTDYTKDTWEDEPHVLTKEELLSVPAKIPEKVQKRVDAVNTMYGEYREALRAASRTCEDRLTEIVSTRFGQDVPFPPKIFALFLGIWTDSVIEKGYEADEAADSMAEVFVQFYDRINLLTAKRNNPNLPAYSTTEMATDIREMIRGLGEDPAFKAQRKRLRAAENNLKRAVKAALASVA